MRESERVAARVRDLLESQYGTAGPASGPAADDAEPVVEAAPRQPTRSRSGPSTLGALAARIPVRLDPGRRAALGVGVAVVIAALVTGIWLAADRPRSLPASSAAPIAGASSPVSSEGAVAPSTPPATTGAASSSASVAVVDVAGKVHRPGVYRLPPGSRIDDAVRAAGGALPRVDLTGLNLAAVLTDGQQIVVGQATPTVGGAVPGGAVPGGAVPSGATTGSTGGSAVGPSGAGGAGAIVNLNTATLEQLQTLPGIGPALGQRILDWRTQHGSFASVDQLNDVSGIGDVRMGQLRPLVSV